MYKTLKEHYWWNEMKREIANFVSRCLTCQQVKTEHQRQHGNGKWEMGKDYYGFCDRSSTDSETT